MDWFERLTGFVEATGPTGYATNHARMEVDGRYLRSKVNGRGYGIGSLELVSLRDLRARVDAASPVSGEPTLRLVEGEAGALHRDPDNAGALFQVASQFNLLEMVGPEVDPEAGVSRYAHDRTQGPACAIAAGAATIYRNYFASVGGLIGQTRTRQLDGFVDLGVAVAQGLGSSPDSLWRMRNGYALFAEDAIGRMSGYVAALDEDRRDALRERLKIGIHWDVEVTSAPTLPGPLVSQAFCSALPIAYQDHRGSRNSDWTPLATLVLEAAYEATLWSAVLNAQRGTSRRVLLTLLGGGAFGNDEAWIRSAIDHALDAVRGHGLTIEIVTYGGPSGAMEQWVAKRTPAAKAAAPKS